MMEAIPMDELTIPTRQMPEEKQTEESSMSNPSDFVIENGVLKKYTGPGGDVVIPEGVKEIGSRAFKRRSDLTGVTFPKSLRKIGKYAFDDCEQLAEIIIPDGVKTIEAWAFTGCRKASRLILPSTLKTIEEWAFQSCGMEEIDLPEGVELVQPTAFSGCSRINRISIPASLRWFNWHGGFGGGDLKSIEVSPDNPTMTSRDGVLFSKDGTTLMCYPCGKKGDYTIPDGVKTIGFDAFSGCSALTGVFFPEGITEIATQAFHGCESLKSVFLPASLRILGRNSFGWCKNLEKIILREGLSSIGEIAFAYCRSLTEISIPDSVTSIGEGAFDECSCLIRTSHWTQMLADAVKNHDRLRQKGTDELRFLTNDSIAVFPANRRRQALLGFLEEEGTDFATERAKSYLDYGKKNAGKLVEAAFDHPRLLYFLCEHQLIPAKDIDAYAAKAEKSGDAEKKALLLNYQNRIGMENVAKARAKKEKSKEGFVDALAERITARDPSKGIEGMTFVITGKLSAWPKVWENRGEVKAYLERYGAFLGTSVTKKTDYLVTNDTDSGSEKNKKAKEYGALVISEADFNEMIGKRFKDAEQITVPSWLKEIPERAFTDCKSLRSITIPEGVTKICKLAFLGCKALKSISLPNSLQRIELGAFYECDNLSDISIPIGVSEIQRAVFTRTAVYNDSEKREDGALYLNGCLIGMNDKYAGSYAVKEGTHLIAGSAFWGCDQLTEISIPESVEYIGSFAFGQCQNLSNIILPEHSIHFGDGAFWNCNRLEDDRGMVVVQGSLFNYSGREKRVTIPSEIVCVEAAAFDSNNVLESVVISEGVSTIKGAESDTGAFFKCKMLRDVFIPKSVCSIGKFAFAECPHVTIHAPASSYAEQFAKENNIPFVAEEE